MLFGIALVSRHEVFVFFVSRPPSCPNDKGPRFEAIVNEKKRGSCLNGVK